MSLQFYSSVCGVNHQGLYQEMRPEKKEVIKKEEDISLFQLNTWLLVKQIQPALPTQDDMKTRFTIGVC